MIVSSINGIGETWRPHAKEWNWTTILHHTQKLKWIKDFNIKPETIKLLAENIGGKLPDMNLGNDFFGFYTKNKGNISKNKQVELHQTKQLLHSKVNHQQNEKATYQMEENICKSYIW